jgi:hypothetical protein
MASARCCCAHAADVQSECFRRVTIRNALCSVRAFVKLGRPLFLVGGFVMYGLGAALAAYTGAKIDWARYAWGQLAVRRRSS